MDRHEQIETNRRIYEDRLEHKRAAIELQGAYGRWLIGSLLLIHGGAFAFLAQGEEFGQRILSVTHWWFVSGLILALVCGFGAWINWSLHWSFMEKTHPAMIYDERNWPKAAAGWEKTWIWVTFWVPIITGLGSTACILGAALWAQAHL